MANEQEQLATVGNHLVSGLGGMVNMFERYTQDGLQLSAGDSAELDKLIDRLYTVHELQEKIHAAGR